MNDETDLRAAEYVLGVDGPKSREAFRRDMERDPELQEAVARWERRFAALAVSAPEVPPPHQMQARIREALAASGPQATIVQLHRALRIWRTAALTSGAIAASVLILAGGLYLRQPPTGETYVAAINRGGDAPALIVRVDLGSGRVFVRPVAAESPTGKSLELWMIGAGAAPRSMGVLGADDDRRTVPPGVRVENAIFAVTAEPPGGSPTGAPTGPVVYSGKLVRE